MDRIVDIAYASLPFRDPFREFDLYIPDTATVGASIPILCFVHGGAWRSEDKADHRLLAHRLAFLTQFPVAVPNYRLTPVNPPGDDHLRHPSHAEDILQFLTFLITWEGPHAQLPLPYDPRKIYVIGHSCSAHMLSSIFLDTSPSTPSLTPPTPLFDAVQAVVISEGIYDLDLLLSSFPGYLDFFVEATFGRRESYTEFSITTSPLRTSKPQMRWLVIHSKGDTLVDGLQSDAMYRHLCQLHASQPKKLVFQNVDQLFEEHNALLRGELYVNIVGKFIVEDHSVTGS